MKTANYVPTMTRKKAHRICANVMGAQTLADACDALERAARNTKGAWRQNLAKLAKGLRQIDSGGFRAPYTVFAKGNSKLPFWSFSTLPQYTCPGAGACLKFCYSFTSWRYPAAFCRQLQNTLLIRFAKRILNAEFNRLKPDTTLRLYVDGDIDSIQTLGFWFRLLTSRPDISAYGYSKSWEVFQLWADQGLSWPANYRLNLSSGSKYDHDSILKSQLANLPITRGEFVAVSDIGPQIKGFARFDDPKYHSAVREKARADYGTPKVFSCPGKCGECLPNGAHACGSDRMRGVLIAIGEHN
jgi:hypothetical protein